MSDDDKKRGHGLVQPPRAHYSDYEMEGDPAHGMTEADRAAFAKAVESQRPKSSADMPMVRIPDRSAPDSQYRAPTPAAVYQESPEERTARFKQKADQLGRQPWRNEAGENDYEVGEDGVISPTKTVPITIGNVGSEGVDRAGRAVAERLPKMTDAQKLQFEIQVAKARARANEFAAGHNARVMQQPGAQTGAALGRVARPTVEAALTKIQNVVAPPKREPTTMSREFPDTPQGRADKEAYIQRARDAARAAEEWRRGGGETGLTEPEMKKLRK